MSWESLTQSYKKRGIVLVLGSGVSVDSKLPNWEQLLERLASEFDASGRRVDFGKLIGGRLPLPVIASLFEEYSRDRNDFVERVRRAVYKDFRFFPKGISGEDRSRFVCEVREQNPTLHAVATLCAVRTKSNHVIPNRLIRAIVSFNLDGLVQAYIHARFEKHLLKTIESASKQSSTSRIHAYHMHGYLQFDPNKANDPSKESKAVVLTEQDYFNFFNNPTSLFNYTFLYLLREATCLFVGLSMLDENIRRMLHLSKQERVVALKNERKLKNECLSRDDARQQSLRHFAILKQNDNPSVDQAIKDSLLPLGTQVLPVAKFTEIRDRLKAMYESSGCSWAEVE
jgi:hypothetical protein